MVFPLKNKTKHANEMKKNLHPYYCTCTLRWMSGNGIFWLAEDVSAKK
jgi:hypothetical protein